MSERTTPQEPKCSHCRRPAREGRKQCGPCRESNRKAVARHKARNLELVRSRGRTYAKAYRERHPDRKRASELASQLRKYGLTPETFERICAEQGGLCPVCALPLSESSVRPAVDHNHETGQVRGVLHPQCNRALGLLRDSPERLRRAALYLERGGV